MNKVMLLGRTTKDVEVKYSQSATPVAVARTGLAVKRAFAKQGEQDTDFFNLVLFGKQAENFQKYVAKGQMIAIEGSIRPSTWEKDGVKHHGVDIIVEHFYFTGGKNETGAEQGTGMGSIPSEDDEDLPF